MSKRAIRRHHRTRMIARAKYVQKKWWGGLVLDPKKLAVKASKLADNIAFCSCHMCCNVRRCRWEKVGETRQELLSMLAQREQADVWYQGE